MQLCRFSPPTGIGAGHNLLPTGRLLDRPTQCQCHHAKRCGVKVCVPPGCTNVELTKSEIDSQWVRRRYTICRLWMVNCISSGEASKCGRKSSIRTFTEPYTSMLSLLTDFQWTLLWVLLRRTVRTSSDTEAPWHILQRRAQEDWRSRHYHGRRDRLLNGYVFRSVG